MPQLKPVPTKSDMGGALQATAEFEDSDNLQKATKMVLGCILNVISRFSGFKLDSCPAHESGFWPRSM